MHGSFAQEASEALSATGLAARIVVDCSHGNSHKRHDFQPLVLRDVAHQVLAGNKALKGAMLESHLVEGNQRIPADLQALVYGQSVTDAGLGWEQTRAALMTLADTLA